MASCPYHGIVQPSNMKSYNSRPLCMGCAERLVYLGGSAWRHASDPKATDSGGTAP